MGARNDFSVHRKSSTSLHV